MRGNKGLTRLTDMEYKHKHVKVLEADHTAFKTLAAKAGKSMIELFHELVKAYKGGKK